uniref:Uncharacterized protein n=1 Tax=Trichobilharzia regenti TaxID=157069 RepID=A0AA85KH07_TRIRE|nr:unnamed protein product [Trichobilharzia regenti]
MESQTLTSTTLSRSDSPGSLLNERTSDTLQSSPTVRIAYSPRLEISNPRDKNDVNNNNTDNDERQKSINKSEKIFLLPGTERVVKVTKKFAFSNDNKEYIDDENEVYIDNDEYDENKTESKYYRTNVSLHKRHRVSHRSGHSRRQHHYQHRQRHHRRHQHSSDHQESIQSPLDSNGYKKPATSSVLSSITYNPTNIDQKRVISRLEFIAPEHLQSDTNENGNTSGEGYLDMNNDMHSYVTSQSKGNRSPGFKQSQLFMPVSRSSSKRKHLNKGHKNYQRSHSSLNRLHSRTSMESSICRKCHSVICPRCHESVNTLSHEHYDSRSLNRADAYCNRKVNGISCPSLDHICPYILNQKYKSLSNSRMQITPALHHHHHHHHRHMCLAKSVPSLSTLDLYDIHPDYLSLHSLGSNRLTNRMEIEYMQIEGDENLNMTLSPAKLNWITDLARQSLNKTKDLDTVAKMMKESLDEEFGKLWHSIVGSDSYGSNLATLPGALISFRVDKWAFLLWQT